ncbi:MAG: glycoside hydrolase family 99-like domain-containing protein [Treponema sp.]|jgi:hypothetical protein|nr:glycoside hydrolase family 99-like domain-containing protein [Treponema sp.]
MEYDIAAYIWPSYTGDEKRSLQFWPEGYGEWQTVKAAAAKYPGHQWPRKPLWGYVNEADPYVMEMEIEAAVDHGVNVFIYDWYWYDNRPFLEQCLDNGFLGAKNNGKMKFYLMWANHNAVSLWDKRISSTDGSTVIWDAAICRSEFEKISRRHIEKYFKLPNYYRIAGKPVFMIYDTPNFIRGIGGVKAAREALDWFRSEAVSAGLGGLHLQMTMWSEKSLNVSGVDGGKSIDAYGLITALGFDSITHYQFVHFADIDRSYPDILKDVDAEWKKLEARAGVPYFPHVSLGWDNNPRFSALRAGVVKDNTPENIEQALRMAKAYTGAHPDQAPLITINSWNEWTETSYLEPDDLYGYGYLEAVRRVFRGP